MASISHWLCCDCTYTPDVGGLLIDFGVLNLKKEMLTHFYPDPLSSIPRIPPSHPVIVEWRAMTVICLLVCGPSLYDHALMWRTETESPQPFVRSSVLQICRCHRSWRVQHGRADARSLSKNVPTLVVHLLTLKVTEQYSKTLPSMFKKEISISWFEKPCTPIWKPCICCIDSHPFCCSLTRIVHRVSE